MYDRPYTKCQRCYLYEATEQQSNLLVCSECGRKLREIDEDGSLTFHGGRGYLEDADSTQAE
jgi:Zn finger protein HypA/HybF involved in hydrogenase expression